MLEIYTGKFGGGKSYCAIIEFVKHLSSGGFLATNITLNFDKMAIACLKKFGWVLEENQIQLLEEHEIRMFHTFVPPGVRGKPTLVAIDEAHMYFNKKDYGEQKRAFLDFVTQSRKSFTDMIFITQHEENLDTQLCRQAMYYWAFRDMQEVEFFGMKYWLPQIRKYKYDSCDLNTPINGNGKMVAKEQIYFDCYDTHELLKDFERPEPIEIGARALRGSRVRSLKACGVAFFGVAMIVFSLSLFADRLGWTREVQSPTGRQPVEKSVSQQESVVNSMLDRMEEDLLGRKKVVGIPEAAFGTMNGVNVVITSDGTVYRKGGVVEAGRVLVVTRKGVVVQRWDGSVLVLIYRDK